MSSSQVTEVPVVPVVDALAALVQDMDLGAFQVVRGRPRKDVVNLEQPPGFDIAT